MKFRRIFLAIVKILAQLLCLFYVVWYAINLEGYSVIIQTCYIIIWGLWLLIWILIDIADILDFVKKRKNRREKNKNQI